ncbi:hypothetical protein I4F81_006833 [Pyropia yezoensis]|uniref:Uncharacterized protein n=1 Tax=Pyropia yezoensis TaxID=2788 RepID=A0ACC3C2C4_PYRYE|nr:hypothetical protein I4F81_006833 [Neopyropia yezoensis]
MLSRAPAMRHLLWGGVPARRAAPPPLAVAAAAVRATGGWLPGAVARGGATRGSSAASPPASGTALTLKGVLPAAGATAAGGATKAPVTPSAAAAAAASATRPGAAEAPPSPFPSSSEGMPPPDGSVPHPPHPLPVPDARRAVVSLAGADASLVTASAAALSRVADAVADLADPRGPLAASLSAGGGPGAAADLALLRAEVARLTNGVFLLVTVGEWNAGKSALLNVLLGGALLPSGPTPTTAEVTVVQHAGGVGGAGDSGGGGAVRAAAADGDGSPPSIAAPVTAGTDHTGEAVKLALHAPWLSHVQLVDTPGTNALDREHEARTRAFVPLADLVLFVTSAERPFSESERAFLASIRAWGKAVVVVLNKVDLLDAEPGSLETVVSYVTDRARLAAGAVAAAYEREVVGTTAAEVGAATAAFGEWLASREAAAWADRRATLAALADAGSPFAADYAAAVSPARVGDSVAGAVAATGAVGLGALGALGVLASASALDATGATGLATAAGAGLLVLPHRRRALRAGTRGRVEALRADLAAATRRRVADGRARHAAAVRAAVAAFAADTAARTAAVRAHGAALGRAGEELGARAAPPPPPTSVGGRVDTTSSGVQT